MCQNRERQNDWHLTDKVIIISFLHISVQKCTAVSFPRLCFPVSTGTILQPLHKIWPVPNPKHFLLGDTKKWKETFLKAYSLRSVHNCFPFFRLRACYTLYDIHLFHLLQAADPPGRLHLRNTQTPSAPTAFFCPPHPTNRKQNKNRSPPQVTNPNICNFQRSPETNIL